MCNRKVGGGAGYCKLHTFNVNMMSTQVLTSLVVLCCLSAVWAMPGHLVLMPDGISKVKNHSSIATFNKTMTLIAI